ncbi:MAG TPA: redoxin domain-containing protein [Euzebyales bacterium]|nr:redoxin domain-containing protein [Euzebyales bacterium]
MSRTETPTEPVAVERARSARPTLRLVAVVGLLVVLGIAGVAMLRPDPPAPAAGGVTADTPRLGAPDRAVGRPIPDVTLPPLAGLGPSGGLALPPGDGEPMVINFWASWCQPCVDEMPMLQRVADDLDLTIVGVDYIDQADKAVALAERLGIRYPLVRDDEGTFGQAVGLAGTPTTLLVDGDGVVRRRLTGELTEQQLRDAIAADLG